MSRARNFALESARLFRRRRMSRGTADLIGRADGLPVAVGMIWASKAGYDE